MKKICILGLGYIGLPTAAMFATHGHKIIGVDKNTTVIDLINQGEVHIDEPYLDIMVQAAIRSGNMLSQTEPDYADVFIIAVPTPITNRKCADLTDVRAATEAIIPYLQSGNIVILESTVPPKTVQDVMIPILEKSGLKLGEEIFMAYSPERVMPGKILLELVENNRIIGGINHKSAELVGDLYKTFVRGEVILTDATTAEMVKLIENSYRDINIAFANEVALICESLGINGWNVIDFANKHPRVNVLSPSPGVGGHCIAVDPWFIIEAAGKLSQLIKTSRKINDHMPSFVANKVENILSSVEGSKVVTILGITYKANVDDMRESPILELVDLLKSKNCGIRVVDPHIKEHDYLFKDIYKAVQNSDLLLLGVNHFEFRHLDFKKIYKLMRNKYILDTRNYWSSEDLQEIGFISFLLGKG